MHGFSAAFAFVNLMWAPFGVFMGNLIGMLPGMGILVAISIFLPLTYTMTHTATLVILSGIYYVRLAVWRRYHFHHANLTGHCLARGGLPGQQSADAQRQSRLGAVHADVFVVCGASVGILAMILSLPLLVDVAFNFSPAEYFSMMLLNLLAGATLAKGSAVKGVAMVVVGLLLGVVGTDVNTGVMRFNFSMLELSDGLQSVARAMGLFGVADFLKNINRMDGDTKMTGAKISMKLMRPEAGNIKQSRGTGIGAAFGVLPGTGPTIASFISYAVVKKWYMNRAALVAAPSKASSVPRPPPAPRPKLASFQR